jgi:hypothetical protein
LGIEAVGSLASIPFVGSMLPVDSVDIGFISKKHSMNWAEVNSKFDQGVCCSKRSSSS